MAVASAEHMIETWQQIQSRRSLEALGRQSSGDRMSRAAARNEIAVGQLRRELAERGIVVRVEGQ
jgi:hypothetical protein